MWPLMWTLMRSLYMGDWLGSLFASYSLCGELSGPAN